MGGRTGCITQRSRQASFISWGCSGQRADEWPPTSGAAFCWQGWEKGGRSPWAPEGWPKCEKKHEIKLCLKPYLHVLSPLFIGKTSSQGLLECPSSNMSPKETFGRKKNYSNWMQEGFRHRWVFSHTGREQLNGKRLTYTSKAAP